MTSALYVQFIRIVKKEAQSVGVGTERHRLPFSPGLPAFVPGFRDFLSLQANSGIVASSMPWSSLPAFMIIFSFYSGVSTLRGLSEHL
jgi:hypothetical protein